jgi:nucleotide-binding universal stress UspA family protein
LAGGITVERTKSPGSIVVGIDGSQAAINAALWAVPEAVSRDVPLRLIHVIFVRRVPAGPPTAADLEGEYAQTALRAASAAVEATGQPVKLETEILWGRIDSAMIEASTDAAMVCVGSVGVGFIARTILGSTAASVAAKAHCPVAVIRTPPPSADSGGPSWVAVGVDGDPHNELEVETAIAEARLRDAPLLAVGVWCQEFGETTYDELDQRVERLRQRHPGVHVYPVSTRSDLAHFLSDNDDEAVQLAVVGAAGASHVARILGPHGHPIAPHGACSVLVAR